MVITISLSERINLIQIEDYQLNALKTKWNIGCQSNQETIITNLIEKLLGKVITSVVASKIKFGFCPQNVR